MSLVIDIGLLALAGYSIFRGYKRGAIMGICSAIVIVIAIIAANVFTSVYYQEFTGLLDPFVGGMVDAAVQDVRGTDTDGLVVVLNDQEKNDVNKVSYAALRQMGVCETASKNIAAQVGNETASFGNDLSNDITALLCGRTMYAVTFFIAFVIISTIFVVIGNILNLKLTVPGFEKINKILGAVIGLFIGITILLSVTLLFRYLGILLPSGFIQKTGFLEWFINHNALANIIGV